MTMSAGSITTDTGDFIFGCDISISGYCDLSGISGLPFPDMKTGITIGIALDPGIVLTLKNGPGKEYTAEYKRVNIRLLDASEKISGFLESRGYKAGFIPPTQKIDDPENLIAPFPHKTAATSAGLGWIGKNDLFVTKEFGTAVRITTVFTNAPLITAEPVTKSYCGICENCRDQCPANAVKGTLWVPGMAREELIDVRRCFDYSRNRGTEAGHGHAVCGICIAACPWTERYLKKEGVLKRRGSFLNER